MRTKAAHFCKTDSLLSNGFLGSFQIDYTVGKFRANGLVGPYFGILKQRALDGVCLSELDRAYHRFDFDRVVQKRNELVGRPGRHEGSFRLRNAFSRDFRLVRFSFVTTVDAFGIPTGLEGVAFDVTDLQNIPKSAPCHYLEDIGHHLKEAKRLAVEHAMPNLTMEIEQVYDFVEGIKTLRSWE